MRPRRPQWLPRTRATIRHRGRTDGAIMTRPWLAGRLAARSAFGLVMSPQATPAAEIKVISANGLRTVLADIAPAFARATGHTLAVTTTETGEIRERILSG